MQDEPDWVGTLDNTPVPDGIANGIAVLLVEDDDLLRAALVPWLERLGCTVRTAATTTEALSYLELFYYDLMLLDLQLPDGSGLDILDHFGQMVSPPIPVLLTGTATVPLTVRAMQHGVIDVIEKPIRGVELIERLRGAFERARGRKSLPASPEPGELIARSPSMRAALELAAKLAAAPRAPVLLAGEPGSGKLHLARWLHEHSRRSANPFVELRVATVPPDDLDPVLFGEVSPETAPTLLQRRGLVASAQGGTLYIDELAGLNTVAQAQLLSIIEDGMFLPIGADRHRPVDTRIVIGTTEDPQALRAEGRLIRELYDHLVLGLVAVPPLRHRIEDIGPMARMYLQMASKELELPGLTFTDEAIGALEMQRWAGNIRELRETVMRIAAQAAGTKIDAEDLGFPEAGLAETSLAHATKDAIEDIEKAHIRRVMHLAGGSPSRAAQMLGISRSTLWRKLKQYGLSQ